jgi:hypothetical protein
MSQPPTLVAQPDWDRVVDEASLLVNVGFIRVGDHSVPYHELQAADRS